jgi:hypothetical protein
MLPHWSQMLSVLYPWNSALETMGTDVFRNQPHLKFLCVSENSMSTSVGLGREKEIEIYLTYNSILMVEGL